MIARFLMSNFSGYIAIAGVLAVLGLTWYIYNQGKRACVNSIQKAELISAKKVKEKSFETKKIEQSLTIIQLNNSLCKLGIVRGGKGCE